MLKKLLITVLVLVALAGAAWWWLTRNVDGLLKAAIEHYGSSMTQARVTVGAVRIAADGSGSIEQLYVGNPAGFKTAHALRVARIELAVEPWSLTQDVVHIRRISVQAPDVIYEKGESTTNFDALANHIAQAVGQVQRAGPGSEGGKKFMVDLLTIRNGQAQASAAFMQGRTVAIKLPDISLKNIGRQSGGVTGAELGQEVVTALKSRLSLAANFGELLKSSADALASRLEQFGLKGRAP